MRKKRKSKYDVVKSELNFEFNSWNDYYDHDYYYYNDDDLYYYDLVYMKKEFYEEIYYGPFFRRSKYTNIYFPYNVIDMNSIYSKQERRNKFIDEILGNSKSLYKPTFEDIWK